MSDLFLNDPGFAGLKPFDKKVWLSSPTMHGEELEFVTEAIKTNWVSTVGANINELERMCAEYTGMKYAVGLSAGTAALHLSTRLLAQKLYPGMPEGNFLLGKKVFCSDMTFDASVNSILYEGGEPIFIDTETDTWNMDPVALEKAFEMYPEVRLVVLAHLYGVPAKMDEIRNICDKHGALIIEDAAEAMGADYSGETVSGKCGGFGDACVISFNGNKICTGSSGGMFLTNSLADADKIRKWSTQSREAAPWYQHEELGYNYRMSNIVAGVARGNMLHIGEHIAQKKAIYERYKQGLADLPVSVNPFEDKAKPNYWLTCMLIEPEYMCREVRGERDYLYSSEPGKSCPHEILDALAAFNAEGRPIWKPMHMQPIYRMSGFVTREGNGRARSNAYIAGDGADVGADIFARGLCLPSDNKMTAEQQDIVIDIIHRCFR
ncbi:MAG: DegT/DnrJ/EryC1/StrS family aminotransferase [Clostridia bacterium]|nr:DegT/DnrJ/EryC1/StrS family aminotransferase [Clostridia bacterium]